MPSGIQSAMTSAQPMSQPSHRGAPVTNNVQQATSPPSKEQLKSWWTKFGRKKNQPEEPVPINQGIFGVPLSESILYANVAISLTNEQGESFIYGYVPIVVAKCGVFLKEKATDVEGIFRLSGSAKRIKDLQQIFNSPDRYGKGLDWTGYTVHDAANILRRYLNQLPEPIVPLDCYERFRDPLRAYQAKAQNDAHGTVESEEHAHAKAVVAYQRLITELPPLNRQLLLYILDLLAVFASKSDLNRMTAQNLAAIFQPGIISHPHHDMAPNEYRLSQEVLIFLIENQDNFLIGMTGTAMDEKTKDEVKSGPPSIKTPKSAIGRSASTASAGADSIRRTGGVRRNGSLSSRHSRDRTSPQVSNPGTPSSPSAAGTGAANTGGLARSNTVPSNRSPAMSGHRFQRMSEASQPNTPLTGQPASTIGSPSDEVSTRSGLSNFPPGPGADIRIPAVQPLQPTQAVQQVQAAQPVQLAQPVQPTHGNQTIMAETNPNIEPATPANATQELKMPPDNLAASSPNNKTNTRDRKISNLLNISPMFGPSEVQKDPNQRQPRKLQKRRIPGSDNESAQSSQASLSAEDGNVVQAPLLTPTNPSSDRPNHMEGYNASLSNAAAPASMDRPFEVSTTSPTIRENRTGGSSLKPPHSPTPSIHSRGSAADPSDLDAPGDPAAKEERKRQMYRLSKQDTGPLAPPPAFGQNPGARTSNSSLGSNRPRKSFTGDSQATQTSGMDSSSAGYPSMMTVASRESAELLKDPHGDQEKKGFFGRMKAKMQQSKEDRYAEKERTKSPPRYPPNQANSRNSLSAFTHDHFSPRGRSFDRPREGSLTVVEERRGHERSGSKTPIGPPAHWPTAPAAPGPVSVPAGAPPQQYVPAGHPETNLVAVPPIEARKSATLPVSAQAPMPAPTVASGSVVEDTPITKSEGVYMPPSEPVMPARASTEIPQNLAASAKDQTAPTQAQTAPVEGLNGLQGATGAVAPAQENLTGVSTQQIPEMQQKPVDIHEPAQINNAQQHS